MKKVKDIPFFKNIREIRECQFGTFYFFDDLVISEINEGVTFGWNMAKKVIDATREIFTKDTPIAYISNRVNDYLYFVEPSDWVKFYKYRNQLGSYSVVGKTKGDFSNIVLERMFFKNSIKQFTDLEEAVKWSSAKLKEHQLKPDSFLSKI